MNLSIRHFRAFVTLAQLRNFTRAAESFHLSQPAFSAMIAALEHAVGAKLFIRDTRNVELTAAGEAFEASAQTVLREVELAVSGLSGETGSGQGKVCVALLPTLAASWLPPILAMFIGRHPAIEVSIQDVLSERGIEQVRSGRCDFAVTTVPIDDSQLISQPFCSDRFDLVCRTDHRLAAASRIRVEDLAGERFIHQVRHGIVGRFLERNFSVGTQPRTIEVEQLATVLGLVRAGIGIAAIPRFNLLDFHAHDLTRKPLHFGSLIRRIYIVSPRDRRLALPARTLFDWLNRHPPSEEPRSRPAQTGKVRL
jgi:DNA-binding transcriptional LysR family regulator